MAFGTGINVSAIKTQRQISVTTGRLNQSFERLSSGLRINRSQDDAAGLAVAEKLRSDSRVATVSMRNANDGISIISIADAAVGEISTILNRLDELAQQSANGSNTNVQRSALQNEFANLMSEVERIAHTTEFNGLNLLSSQGAMTFQVGFNGSSLSGITFSGIAATLGSMGLSQLGSSRHTFSILAATDLESQDAARAAVEAIKGAIASIGRSRGTLGAAQSRLEATIRQLATSRESFQAAESGIADVDVAQETSEMTRLGVLQQAGTAILAQANFQPGLALKLLNQT